MDSHTLEGLTLRLEAAERGLKAARRAIWTGSLLVMLGAGGAVYWLSERMTAAGAPEAVEAQHFVVRDAQGFARGVFESLGEGGTQLVVFRGPRPGDQWRERAGTGPFSFGVRSLRDQSQLMLGDRDGAVFQLMSSNLSFTRPDSSRMFITTDDAGSRIWLADWAGSMQVLMAGPITDALAKRAAPASHLTRHRRRR